MIADSDISGFAETHRNEGETRIPATTTQTKRLAVLRGPDRWWKHPMVYAFAYPGRLDVPRLAQALRLVARRHSSLRTYFLADGPIDTVGCLLPDEAVWPLREMTAGADPDSAAAEAYAWLQQPFSPDERPLIRAVVLHRAEADMFGLSIEHSIIDPTGVRVLFGDLAMVYEGLIEQPPSVFDELVSDATGFARAERAWIASAAGERALSWWDEQNAGLGAYPGLDLHELGQCDSLAPYISHQVDLSVDDVDRLRKNAAALRLTPSMLASAATAVTLRSHGHSADVRFHFATSRRLWPQTQELVAYCSNRMMLRVQVDAHDTVSSLAPKVRAGMLDAVEHSMFSHEEYVRARFPDAYVRKPTTYGYLNVNTEGPGIQLDGVPLTRESLPVVAGDYHQPGLAMLLFLYKDGTGVLDCSCAQGMYEIAFVDQFAKDLARCCVGGS
ncbi:condensation domain-containing protein [Micromonospora sp. DR5-3]|uniref:condensation domain-containing protein n=1 Tax=unclassified Micromonospora TaxID=2617518 RepID=UPI001CA33EB0|nr:MULTISPECIES: condensation domain-containing protein [unclassified Micromonospora]MCW3815795.1 condensation domain-containing protein [Micromonospora sp. DR5-3]